MNKIKNKILNFINNEIRFFPLILTLVTVYLATSIYRSAEDYSAVIGVLRLVVLLSAVLMVLFFHYTSIGKEEFSSLFSQAFASLLLGIMSLLLVKTMFGFGYLPFFSITISVYIFYNLLVKLYFIAVRKKK